MTDHVRELAISWCVHSSFKIFSIFWFTESCQLFKVLSSYFKRVKVEYLLDITLLQVRDSSPGDSEANIRMFFVSFCWMGNATKSVHSLTFWHRSFTFNPNKSPT
jgi:hypothetical protein